MGAQTEQPQVDLQANCDSLKADVNKEKPKNSPKFARRMPAVRFKVPINRRANGCLEAGARTSSLDPPSPQLQLSSGSPIGPFLDDSIEDVSSQKKKSPLPMKIKALTKLRRSINNLASKTCNRFSARSSRCSISSKRNRQTTYYKIQRKQRPIIERFSYSYLTLPFILAFIFLTSTATSQTTGNAYAQSSTVLDAAAAAGSINSAASSPGVVESEPEVQSTASSCFGGLQTFEKISMSSFENPSTGSASSAAFGSGILVQQDDQALTSECVNLCRSQSNCLSFVIDYNKFECKSYATTQQELQQEFDAKFQAPRNTDNNNNNNNYTVHANQTGGPQESASNLNIQNLLPSASSNYFEKICLDGIANRNQFSDVCGQGRLWTIERVVDSFLDGYVEKEVTNVNNKNECSKLCIFETQFVCRSADYDQHSRLCRLSKENRRTQPQAMRNLPGSNRHYLENQCASPGPSSCVYETKNNLAIISMDSLKFAQTVQDCQMKCTQETTFNCRSYSFSQQRCFLSGDDSFSLNNNLIKLPVKQGWQFGEKKCLVDLCTKGLFSYEKITGYTLRSASSMPIDLMAPGGSTLSMVMVGNNYEDLEKLQSESSQSKLRQLLPIYNPRNGSPNLATSMMMAVNSSYRDPMDEAASSIRYSRSTSNLAITNQCRHSCDLGYLNCPAFTIDYKNNRCQRLDRNSQGRHHDLVARDGFAYYEKICLRVPEIMSMCQDKLWIFERVIGYELAPRLYEKYLKFVQSRRDCEEYCLEEKQFQCRSALYNDETSDCKLSRYDRRLAMHEGGYYKNFNVRVSYLENQCIRDQSLEKSSCYFEQARDEPSYPTFTEHIEMVQQSPAPSIRVEMESTGGLQQDKNRTHRFGSSYCEQLCNDNAKFECHSFGYYASTAQCFLSGDDSVSAGETAATPSTGFTYFEKKCRPAMGTMNGGGGMNKPPSESTVSESPPLGNWNQNIDPYMPSPGRATTASYSTESSSGLVTPKPQKNPYGSSVDIDSRPTGSSGNSGSIDQFKCGLGHSFVYQRISGFEPIGGYLTLLVKNNNSPGIVSECADMCKKARDCQAFVVDYESNQCYAMLDNSSVGMLNLRQTIGKDYFEGFCISEHLLTTTTSSCKSKSWVIDRIVDQAVVGVQHHKLISDSDRMQCRQACIEERLFWCKSAMFDSTTNDCKLYSIDRETIPQMRLVFNRGIDFFENQCQIVSNTCPYDAIERDMTIVTTTKSVQARSTFDCEQSCNSETSFNCRSYTYLDQYPSLPNLCLLSSDSRSTGQKGSVRERSRTLYAERNCYFRRPRYPGGTLGQNPVISLVNTQGNSDASASQDPYAMPPASPGHSSIGSHLPPRISQPSQTEMIDDAGGVAVQAPAFGCEPHRFTFERTFGYDFRSTQRERAPIAPTVGIAIGCQQECIRRGNQCQSFVVEYALPYQSCFLIETQVGANKKLLIKSPNHAYFEKICLPRTGIDSESLNFSKPPASVTNAGSADMSIAPSYGTEPWSLQVPDQLPYYLQQQQLVQSYPGRSCAKLWTFERFVNHNFTAPSDRVLDNILTKGQCETLCLNEASFSCRSATYDYNRKLCRLFKNTRRTIMSQFFNLEVQGSDANSSHSSTGPATNSHPGTAVVLNAASSNEAETLQALNSNTVTALDGLRRHGGGRQMQQPLSSAEPRDPDKNIDYMENTCVAEPSSCQYRQLYDMFSPYIDKINHAVSLSDCQRQCDLERLFTCKSINYDPGTRNCMLINEDLISIDRGQQSSLTPRKNSIYSEKGNCEMISVQCNSQEMLVSINFDAPFRGRLMAKGNPEQCYLIGDGQTSLQFPIVFGPKCNSRQEGHNTFVNEVIIQQHPVIMTDSDKTVRVMCAFEAPDQTITLKNPSSHENKTGIDVGAPEMSRTRHDKQHFNSVVSNKASPPSVLLRILDLNGRDASMINLGDDLVLKIQMQTDGQNSALGIFARNLAARSSNGETLLLIDNDGCPVDPQIFPALEVDQKDGKSLYSTFKAFRFPSSGLVNFEVQIRFCPERCKPVECTRGGQKMRSYGRKRRKRQTGDTTGDEIRTPLLMSVNSGRVMVDSLSTVMKPGKALQHVRELMLGAASPDSSGSLNVEQPVGDPSPAKDRTVAETPDADLSQEFGSNTNSSIQSIEQNSNSPDGSFMRDEPENSNKFTPAENSAVSTAAPISGIFQDVAASAKVTEGSQQIPFQKSILMHVDEKIVPSTRDYIHPRITNQIHSPIAPYGRLPMQDTDIQNNHHHHNHQQAAGSQNSDQELHSQQQINPSTAENEKALPHEEVTNSVAKGVSSMSDPPSAPTEQVSSNPSEATVSISAPDLYLTNHKIQGTIIQTNDIRSHSSRASDILGPGAHNLGSASREETTTPNPKDVPLRFSILVGENQGSGNNWVPGGPLIMNSTNSVDMDHIVIPGRGGQLEQAAPPRAESGGQIDSSSPLMSAQNGHSGYNGDVGDTSSHKIFSGSKPTAQTSDETSKDSKFYEQTFDALPSNSVAAEVKVQHSQGNYDAGSRATSGNHKNRHSAGTLSPSELAASQDCQSESSNNRFRSIIWAGSLVIALNITLVVLSLALYLKRLHLSQNHRIQRVFASNSQPTESRRQWNKNNCTSLNAHEHFFYKLNGSGSSSGGWPNLSSSSSHSTVSSMVSPLPVSNVKISQSRVLKFPFDSHSSLRNDPNLGQDNSSEVTAYPSQGNQYRANYTSDIDEQQGANRF